MSSCFITIRLVKLNFYREDVLLKISMPETKVMGLLFSHQKVETLKR